MKVLFIYANTSKQEGISPAIAYLSGYLKKKGHKTGLFDFTWGDDKEELVKSIKDFNPDLIAFTADTLGFGFCVRIANEIKKLEIPIIFGGPHPTLSPEEAIRAEPVDIICIGEGEEAMGELMKDMKNKKVKNIWFKKGSKIIKNPIRNLLEDIDSIECDRELFDYQRYLDSRGGIADIYAGRGCPFSCSYCINPSLKRIYKGKGEYVRMRKPESIVKEIKELKRRYKITGINFTDDTFTWNKKWLEKFCELYGKEIRLPFTCNGRVENIDEKTAEMLRKAGCNAIMFGVESGSERIRKDVLKRPNTDEQIISAFEAAKTSGIKTFSYNMVGIPFEAEEDIKKTIELNRRIKPDEVQTTIFYPFPGTELYEICKSKGWIKEHEIPDYKYGSVMKYPHISSARIKRARDFFAFHVFRKSNPKKAMRSLFSEVSYNLYVKIRQKLPPQIKASIQRITNTFYFSG